ncbi:SulP family inorganic anion transporter [Salsipaludibacter albus]|uniref:SulP family inorganic anion transporter n=1 Tax=Salsipaludibacter albus TaxID=2849650 RepID=UPI001EE43E7F|nr:SulP family inorganic anion transporter [Salsipaludibacter albus]MBY5162616.1 cyclic nucleotide-binding domain-containing protein [Salsipaludibacter albus]
MAVRVRDVARQLAAGVVVAVVGISLALSLAALVFRGPLAGDLATGAGWALVGMVTIGIVVGLGSSVRGMVAGPQDVPNVVLAAVAADLVADLATDPLPTLAAFVVVSSVVTGLALVVGGRRRLGGLVRFVPYPVVAGFLGGTAVVLCLAGGSILLGSGPTDEPWLRLLPGIALAVALAWFGRRGARAAVPALLVVVGVVVYHAGALLAGVDGATASARGLVLGPFPSGPLFDPGVLGELGRADWGAVAGQVPAMLALTLLLALGMLLNLGALELELDRDVDADRELVATGVGLLAAAPFAGLPGFIQLGPTMMGRRIGGGSRVPVLVGALLAGVVLLLGADVLALVPTLLTGALLLTIGIDFALTWLWDVRHRVGPVEHVVILSIVVVVATVGFLEGVGFGLLAATVMYVVRSSRVGAVRSRSTLGERRSHVQRAAADEAVLDRVGRRASIVELQGFVFFGTADQVVATVVDGLDADPEVEFLVVDLARVTGVDSSALASFHRLARHAGAHGVEVVVSGCSPAVLAVLAPVLAEGVLTTATDLDHAVEAGEERLLAGAAADHPATDPATDPATAPGADMPLALRDVVPTSLPAGHVVVSVGDRDVGLYLLTAGRATVTDTASRDRPRHALLLPGTVIGELSLLSGRPANATVVCETDCEVRHLTTAEVTELVQRDPRRALDLHQFIARRLAGKLAAADRTIASLR